MRSLGLATGFVCDSLRQLGDPFAGLAKDRGRHLARPDGGAHALGPYGGLVVGDQIHGIGLQLT